jgi:hypothetical protein
MFEREHNLRQWVHDAHPPSLVNVLDKKMIEVNHDVTGKDDNSKLFGCLHWVVEIALECSAPSPRKGFRCKMSRLV